MWQSRHERHLFSITTRRSQRLQCCERTFDQGTSGLAFNNVPDEADKFNDRRLTFLAQLVSDKWNSGRDDAKRAGFDLVRVYRPSIIRRMGSGEEKKTHPRVLGCQHHATCSQELSGRDDVHDAFDGILSPSGDRPQVAFWAVVGWRRGEIQEMRDDVGGVTALSVVGRIRLGRCQGRAHKQNKCLYAAFERSRSRRRMFLVPTT